MTKVSSDVISALLMTSLDETRDYETLLAKSGYDGKPLGDKYRFVAALAGAEVVQNLYTQFATQLEQCNKTLQEIAALAEPLLGASLDTPAEELALTMRNSVVSLANARWAIMWEAIDKAVEAFLGVKVTKPASRMGMTAFVCYMTHRTFLGWSLLSARGEKPTIAAVRKIEIHPGDIAALLGHAELSPSVAGERYQEWANGIAKALFDEIKETVKGYPFPSSQALEEPLKKVLFKHLALEPGEAVMGVW